MKIARKVATKSSHARGSQRKATKQSSLLFDIFRQHYCSLETLTSTCVTTITSKLYSNNLISGDVQDQVITGQDSDSRKASKVLHNLKQQITINPRKLLTLVEVLKEEPVFDDLTEGIASKYITYITSY